MKATSTGAVVCAALAGLLLGSVGVYLGVQRGWLAPAARPDAHAVEETGHNHAGEAGAPAYEADAHAGAGAAHEEHRVVIAPPARAAAGIELAVAAGGDLDQTVALPGEIVLNADRVAHIVPRVSGIVRRVDKVAGDRVQPGEVMLQLESRELAETKAAYLAAQQRLALARANLASAEQLHTQKIMPDLEFLAIQKAAAESKIDADTAENRLHALGITDAQLAQLPPDPDDLAVFEVRAPFAGTVIAKHCTLGEVLSADADAFVLADLSTVWANITVYAQDIARVQIGQPALIRADGITAEASAPVTYITPLLNENTRAACARVELTNDDGRWRPGTFVTAIVRVSRVSVDILVPLDALQRLEDQTVVFVEEGDALEARPVKLGRTSPTAAEVLGGLDRGQRYVVRGAYVVKADLLKSMVSHEH